MRATTTRIATTVSATRGRPSHLIGPFKLRPSFSLLLLRVPAAAECLIEVDQRRQMREPDLRERVLCGQQRGFSGEDGEYVDGTGMELPLREIIGAPRRLRGAVLTQLLFGGLVHLGEGILGIAEGR